MPLLTDEDVGLTLSDADVGIALSDADVGIEAQRPPPQGIDQITERLFPKPAPSLQGLPASPNVFSIEPENTQAGRLVSRLTGVGPPQISPAAPPRVMGPEELQAGTGLPMISEAERRIQAIKESRGAPDMPTEEFVREHPDTKYAIYGLMGPTDIPMKRLSPEEGQLLFGKSVGPAMSGAQNAVADFVDFATSAPGVMTALTGGVAAGAGAAGAPLIEQGIHRATAYAFATDMAKNMPEQFAGVVDAINRGDAHSATQGILGGLAALTIIGGAGKAAVSPMGRRETGGVSTPPPPQESASQVKPAPISEQPTTTITLTPKTAQIVTSREVLDDLVQSLTKGQIRVGEEARPAPQAAVVEPQPVAKPVEIPKEEVPSAVPQREPEALPLEEPPGNRPTVGERIPEPEAIAEAPRPPVPPEAPAAAEVAPPPPSDVPPGQSAQPAAAPAIQAEISQKGKPVSRGVTARRRFNAETEQGGPDVLSWIEDNMKLLSKSAAKKLWGKEKFKLNASLWDDATPLDRPHHNVIYDARGAAPDRVAQAAFDAGVLKEPSVNELWEAIRQSSKTRANAKAALQREQAFLEAEAKEHEAWMKATEGGEVRVEADQLKVGDLMEVEGERVEVVAVDADTGDVTLKDGRKFGRQTVASGKALHVEKFDPTAEEPFFAKPESVEEQSARLAAEEEARQKKAQREQLETKAAQPLIGKQGDIGQGDLLGGGDLFSAKQPGSIGAGMKAALEKNQRGEAGFITIPTREELLNRMGELPEHVANIFRWANRQRQHASDRLRRYGERDQISAAKDSADNRAKIAGGKARNVVLHSLNRVFGVAPRKVPYLRNSLREAGLTFAIEAGGDKSRLAQMRETLLASNAEGLWRRRALRAIDFAERNWERYEPIVELYKIITDSENAFENANGVRTLYRQGGYVFHLQDMGEKGRPSPSFEGGVPAPFRHIRDYPTYAESIAAGVNPRSLSAVDLLHKRVQVGQRLINYGDWIDTIGQIQDPITGEMVMQPPIARMRQDGTTDMTAPPGYTLTKFANRDVAVHNGYIGLIDDLKNPSIMAGEGVRKVIMQSTGLAKHLMLLFDTFHMGRLAFWNSVSRLGAPTYQRGYTLLDNTVPEIQSMIANGEIPAKWGEGLIDAKGKLDNALKAGLNVGNISDNLYTDVLQKIPGIGTFNKWLFEKYQRGAMAEVFLIELERQRKMFPGDNEMQLTRRVVKDINTRFGNLQSQGWIKGKTFQDLARIIFLAPQWNEGLLRSELGALKQLATAPRETLRAGRPAMGGLARGIGTALLGIFFANQIINMATRGHPTWENEEEDFGAKISAWIPDAAGGPGFFLNPMSVPVEMTHLLMNNTERNWNPKAPVESVALGAADMLKSRFSSLSRGVWTFTTGQTTMGEKIKPGQRLERTAQEAAPLPISGSAAYRFAKQQVTGEHQEKYPGQFQKQLMQSFGIKTEQAPSAEQRIRHLVTRFNHKRGVGGSQGWEPSVYSDLTAAVRRGNMTDAKEALANLLEMQKANGEKHTAKDVRDYYKQWERRNFTMNGTLEREFRQQLTPAQRAVYEKAREERRKVARKVGELLNN